MNNLNDLIRIWCLLLILVACNQDDNMDCLLYTSDAADD